MAGARRKKIPSIRPSGSCSIRKLETKLRRATHFVRCTTTPTQRLEEALALLRNGYHLAPVAPETPRTLIHQIIQKNGLRGNMGRFTGILGMITLLGLGYAFSTNRRAIRWKTIAWGLGLQFAFALFVLKFHGDATCSPRLEHGVEKFLELLRRRIVIRFWRTGQGQRAGTLGFASPFSILPTIIFVAAFFAVMYYSASCR